jgi:hypothetical protein
MLVSSVLLHLQYLGASSGISLSINSALALEKELGAIPAVADTLVLVVPD